MEWRLAEVIEMPCGVGSSSKRGVPELARFIVQPVSAGMVWLMLGRGLVVDLAWLL